MKTQKAHWLWNGFQWQAGPWEVRWQDSQIIEIKICREAPPRSLIMPGLINAHCHLELSALKAQLSPTNSFTQWVRDLRALNQNWQAKDWRASFAQGVKECFENGITSVVDVGNSGASWLYSSENPLRIWAFYEVMGKDPKLAEERMKAPDKLWKSVSLQKKFTPGITSHAPFSTSRELLEKTLAFQKQNQSALGFSIHFAESAEEQEFYAEQKGALWEMTKWIYPNLNSAESIDTRNFLWNPQREKQRELWVHGNFLTHSEINALAEQEVAVVHCPRSRAFFSNPMPELSIWEGAGLTWLLGTDSVASCPDLNLWQDLRSLYRVEKLSSEKLLHKVTAEAGAFLGFPLLGQLCPAAPADFIVLEATSDFADPAKILEFNFHLKTVVIDGVEVL